MGLEGERKEWAPSRVRFVKIAEKRSPATSRGGWDVQSVCLRS